MTLGKARPKLSFTTRKLRLGVAHHGAPSTYTAPQKDRQPVPEKKPRR